MSLTRQPLPDLSLPSVDLGAAAGPGLLPPVLGPGLGPLMGNDWMKSLLGGEEEAKELPKDSIDQLTPGARARLEESGMDLETFRSSVSERARSSMLDEDGELPKGFAEALAGASLTELSMLDDLGASGLDAEGLGQVLRGGHVKVEDGGALYEQWSSFLTDNPAAQERSSSHYGGTDATQYGVRGSLFKEGLFGLTRDPGSKEGAPETWLQLEGSPAHVSLNDPSSLKNLADKDKAKDTADHMVDYVKYKLTGDNQGPWGSSEHTEKNRPLVLDGQSTRVDESLHSEGLIDKVKGKAGDVVNKVGDVAGGVKDKVSDVAGGAWDGLKSGLGGIL